MLHLCNGYDLHFYFLVHQIQHLIMNFRNINLFTTSESPKYSNPPIFCCFRKSMLHKCYICMTFFLHELMQYVHSVVLFFEIMHYKYCNWTASFLHELIIPVHSVFVRKIFAAIITFEWLISFMKWFNMPVQSVLVRKSFATIITIEWLLSFMTILKHSKNSFSDYLHGF